MTAHVTLAPLDAFARVSAEGWERARTETIDHLQRLIRIRTVNPPGDEIHVANYLAGVFRDCGIATQLFEPSPGRAALIARIAGDGSRQPVILLAHMDTVNVEAGHWTTDPFGGEIREGYLYGRGAIDDKGMLAANLMTMLLLKRHVVDAGVALSRDVIFVATSDEEAGGAWGMDWLVRNHPELVRGEFALNEGGRTRIVGGRPLYVAVQSAEKVSHVVTILARGPGGHAAVPLEGNALTRLGRALAAVAATREPMCLTPVTREFFSALSAVWPDPAEAQAMSDVVSGEGEREQRGSRVLAGVPVLDAVLRNGVSPVMLQAGQRHNVIPTEASALLNVRTLPGQDVEQVVERLRRAIADPQVELSVTERGEDAPASDFASPMFAAIRESVRALDPSLTVVPYLSTGATDSARLRRWGMQAFGILPFPMEQGDEDRMHGNDERIPLTALHFGTQLIFGAIARVAATRA